MSDPLRPHGLKHTRLPCPSPTPGACSISCPSSLRCHPTISSSVIPFSSSLQSSPSSGPFLMSQFFVSGDQNTGVSASSSILNIHHQGIWHIPLGFPLWLTGLISLQSKLEYGLPKTLDLLLSLRGIPSTFKTQESSSILKYIRQEIQIWV